MKKIFLVGTGTGGPITPLLAVGEELKKLHPTLELYFVGNKRKVEEAFLQTAKFKFQYLSIPAGKWRRYFSLRNLLDLFKIVAGFLKSLLLIKRHKPDVILGAGSYSQVPMCWAAYLSGVPIVIHQPDLTPLLSTKLVAPIASMITVSFAVTGKNIPEDTGLLSKKWKSKVKLTGNPVRPDLENGHKDKATKLFQLDPELPTVLVMGGGAGSETINHVVSNALPDLTKYVQVIHLTGKQRKQPKIHNNYHAYPFLGNELKHAYAASDLVVSRAGIGSISELIRLKKTSVLIPLPNSPQELNAAVLGYYKAAIVIPEDSLSAGVLVDIVRKTLWNAELLQNMPKNLAKLQPPHAESQIAKLVSKIIYHEK